MSELHFIGIDQSHKAQMELVDPSFVMEGLLNARLKTWSVLHQIRGLITEGMTEHEARQLALQIFADHGVTKHWHKPHIRFGAGTALTYHEPMQVDYRIKQGDPFYIDVGPVWLDPKIGLAYEGDAGDTFVLGKNPEAERCAVVARQLFYEAQQEWHTKKWNGKEIYQYLKIRASELGYILIERVDGHRLADFPHHKYSRERLAHIEFDPSMYLWVLEIEIVDPSKMFGAFFEDLLQHP